MLKLVCNFSSINGFGPRHVSAASSYSSSPTKTQQQQQQQQQQQKKEHPSSSLPNFFMKNLGFSKQQSLSLSAKLAVRWTADAGKARVSALTFAENANSVIHFFKLHGFNDSQIRNVVSYDPRILSTIDVNKTLVPKFKVLQDLGISDSDLVSTISSKPSLIHARLDVVLQDLDLRAFFGTSDHLLEFCKESVFSTSASSLRFVVPNARLLQNDYGFSTESIRPHIIRKPLAFMRRTTLFKDTLIKVEHKWGISPSSGMFLYAVGLFGSAKADLTESKIRVFKSFGWNQSHITTIVRKCPSSLFISEAKLRKSLGFLMNEMGHEPAYLACRPALLMYSLEKKIMPRQRIWVVLKENDLISTSCDFYAAVSLTESKFFYKFVQPFKDVAPDLYQNYLSSRGLSETSETEK